MTKRVALYLRVSTSEQNTDNQRCELEAVAVCDLLMADSRMARRRVKCVS